MKIVKLAIIFLLVLFPILFISATAPPNTAVCEIKGIIENITFTEAYNDSCLENKFGCPTDFNPIHRAAYHISTSITGVNFISMSDYSMEGKNCSDLYKLEDTLTIHILKEHFNEEDINKIGKLIITTINNYYYAYILEYTILDQSGGPLYKCGDKICQPWELTESYPSYCPQDCIETNQTENANESIFIENKTNLYAEEEKINFLKKFKSWIRNLFGR